MWCLSATVLFPCLHLGEEYCGQTKTLRSGKPWTFQDREVEHYKVVERGKLPGCHKLNCAIKKHGRAAFTTVLLAEVPVEEGNVAEISWITERNTFDGENGLNMAPGEWPVFGLMLDAFSKI